MMDIFILNRKSLLVILTALFFLSVCESSIEAMDTTQTLEYINTQNAAPIQTPTPSPIPTSSPTATPTPETCMIHSIVPVVESQIPSFNYQAKGFTPEIGVFVTLEGHMEGGLVGDTSIVDRNRANNQGVVEGNITWGLFVSGGSLPNEMTISLEDENGKCILNQPVVWPEGGHISLPGRAVAGKFISAIDDSSYVKDSIIISPNYRRLLYVNLYNNKYAAVIDGEEGDLYQMIGGFTFSPDNNRIAYQAQVNDTEFVEVVDGTEGKTYAGVSTPIFSPDGQSLVYAFQFGDKLFYNIDGKEVGPYDDLDVCAFSPDSQHMAYLAFSDNLWFIVVDGEEIKEYDDVYNPIFSPDSQRLVFLAVDGNKEFMVVDGVEGGQYDQIITEMVFSPDSQHLAYGAQVSENQVMVLDGKEGKPYNSILWPTFSPDSQQLAYVAKEGDQTKVVVMKLRETRTTIYMA